MLGVLVFTGHLLSALFARTRIPDVLLLMLLGAALGPYGLAWVGPDDFGKVGPVLTTIALIVILFEGGTNLRLSTVGRVLPATGVLTLLTSIATGILVALLVRPVVGHWPASIMLGAILAGTSSAVVIPLVDALRLEETPRAVLALESALTDVLCIALVFGLLQANQGGALALGPLLGGIGASLVLATLVGAVGGLLWLMLRVRLKSQPNAMFMAFAYVFVLFGYTEWLGYSGAIAALAFGVTSSNLSPKLLARTPWLGQVAVDPFTAQERNLFAEAVFLVKLFFFIYLGLSLRFDRGLPFAVAAGVVVVVYAARLVITRAVLNRTTSRRSAAMTAVMVPKGLAAAVLASLPLQHGVAGGEQVQDIAFAVVFVSIALTSVLVPILELKASASLLDRLFARFAPPPVPSAVDAGPAAEAPVCTSAPGGVNPSTVPEHEEESLVLKTHSAPE